MISSFKKRIYPPETDINLPKTPVSLPIRLCFNSVSPSVIHLSAYVITACMPGDSQAVQLWKAAETAERVAP